MVTPGASDCTVEWPRRAQRKEAPLSESQNLRKFYDTTTDKKAKAKTVDKDHGKLVKASFSTYVEVRSSWIKRLH